MEPLSFSLGFLLLHLPHQSLFLFPSNPFCLLPFPLLNPHVVHMPLGYQASEVALEFDDAVQAATEAATGDVAATVALQAKDTPPQGTIVPGQLAGSPCGLESGKPPPHLRSGGGRGKI